MFRVERGVSPVSRLAFPAGQPLPEPEKEGVDRDPVTARITMHAKNSGIRSVEE
jgi:hypothetical protein